MSSQFDAQRAATNAASTIARHAHLALLGFIAYSAITVWSTTDEQLLRGSAVTLPLLNVAVSIVGFYTITPWLLLVLHSNFLLYVMLLSSRMRGLEDAMTASMHPVQRRGELLQLESFSITQSLNGDDEGMITRSAARIVSFVSIYLLPVAMLLWLQIRFLPVHKPLITVSQRWAICLDLLCLWLFSWQIRPSRKTNGLRMLARMVMGVATICILFFSFEIAVAPRIPSWWVGLNKNISPWLGDWPNSAIRSVPRALEVPRKTLVAEAPSQEVLAAYYQRGEPIDSAWIQHAQGLNFTERDLRYTNFERSRLWNADFRGSRLDGVNFNGAVLRGVVFTTREGVGGGATLYSYAMLPEAALSAVNYPEGDLLQAVLDFSDLTQVTFVGSDMRGAKLRGASLRFADLRGAALARVNAGGAEFIGADLRGADLRGANLQAADLGSARLQGADLRGSMLQGATFKGATLQGADLREAVVFGTDFDKADLTLADLRGVRFSDPSRDEEVVVRPYTASGLYRYRQFVDRIKSRLEKRENTLSLNSGQHADAIFDKDGPFRSWGDSIPLRKYEDKVASLIVSLACDDRHIARGLLWEQHDPIFQKGSLLPRTGILDSLDADPILLRRALVLIKGLETRKCHALPKLDPSELHKLNAFLKEREHLAY